MNKTFPQDQDIRRYPFLDGFRGFSILGVLLTHANLVGSLPATTWGLFLARIFKIGHLGVDAFFVISGFLITGILIEDWNGHIRIKRFYLRRFFKIIPQYLAALFFTFGAITLLNAFKPSNYPHINLGQIMTHVFFIQNYTKGFPPLEHTWSLCIEEHFYWVYPLLLYIVFLTQKQERSRRLTLIRVTLLLLTLTIISRHALSGKDFVLFFTFTPYPLQTTFCRIDALLFGCLLKFLEPYYTHDGQSRWKLWAPLCFIMGISIYAHFIRFGFLSQWDPYLLAYLAVGFLFLAAYKGFRPLKELSENVFFQWVGKNSYGIYLWHYILAYFLKPAFQLLPPLFAFCLFVAISIIFGAVTTTSIEKYFLNIRKRLVP